MITKSCSNIKWTFLTTKYTYIHTQTLDNLVTQNCQPIVKSTHTQGSTIIIKSKEFIHTHANDKDQNCLHLCGHNHLNTLETKTYDHELNVITWFNNIVCLCVCMCSIRPPFFLLITFYTRKTNFFSHKAQMMFLF